MHPGKVAGDDSTSWVHTTLLEDPRGSPDFGLAGLAFVGIWGLNQKMGDFFLFLFSVSVTLPFNKNKVEKKKLSIKMIKHYVLIVNVI